MTPDAELDTQKAVDLGFAIERRVLANRLRVVLNPDPGVPTVGVAVVYDVGVRSEPPGRSGFAHLFEHLMFQGSANLEKLAHSRYMQGFGGTFNGSTSLDYTYYFESAPSSALEWMLFLEADRMRSPRVTGDTLRNQVDVVKEEIRRNVLHRPYGGFPWLTLPPVMFDLFPNAHDGYGAFEDLDAATVGDALTFFDTYYGTGNAVLCVSGDFDLDAAWETIERQFGSIESRPAPSRPSCAEPDLRAERQQSYVDPLASAPAVALAWRVPDSGTDLLTFVTFLVLVEVLTDGRASRLVRRLMIEDGVVTSVRGRLGFMGEPFGVREPTALLLQANLPRRGNPKQVIASIDEEIARLARDGLTDAELDRVRSSMVAAWFRSLDSVEARTLRLAVFEIQHGDARAYRRVAHAIASVTADQIRAAAACLSADRRAGVEVRSGRGVGSPLSVPANGDSRRAARP